MNICELTLNVPSHKIMVSPSDAAAIAVLIEAPPIKPGDVQDVPAPTEPLGATYKVLPAADAVGATMSEAPTTRQALIATSHFLTRGY